MLPAISGPSVAQRVRRSPASGMKFNGQQMSPSQAANQSIRADAKKAAKKRMEDLWKKRGSEKNSSLDAGQAFKAMFGGSRPKHEDLRKQLSEMIKASRPTDY